MALEAEGASPAMITDHAFAASPWWERCPVCRLSMAAHLYIDVTCQAAMQSELEALPNRGTG